MCLVHYEVFAGINMGCCTSQTKDFPPECLPGRSTKDPHFHEDTKGIVGGAGLIRPAAGTGMKSSPAGRTGGVHGVQPAMYQEG